MAQVTEELAKTGAIFYDTEIVSCIPSKGELRDQKYRYCNGWSDHKGMGISVIGVYDFVTKAYRVFLGDNLGDFKSLVHDRWIIMGFNNYRFDDVLMAANGVEIPKAKSYDLWKEITNTQPHGTRKGFALNDMLKANGLSPKSGEGGNAPKLAQDGKWGELINYCLDDVRLSIQLIYLLCGDIMKHPKNGGYMVVKKPWEIVKENSSAVLFP